MILQLTPVKKVRITIYVLTAECKHTVAGTVMSQKTISLIVLVKWVSYINGQNCTIFKCGRLGTKNQLWLFLH